MVEDMQDHHKTGIMPPYDLNLGFESQGNVVQENSCMTISKSTLLHLVDGGRYPLQRPDIVQVVVGSKPNEHHVTTFLCMMAERLTGVPDSR